MTIKFIKGNINPTTKKFPRTLAEAFPDAPEPNFDRPMDKEDVMVIAVCVIVAILFVAAIVGGLA